ncbi:hypothetical protein AYO21_01986 [Fonsecaea monophora]|uniref:Uncharacterized protein n=1 Tax=Fonsecaea monophora TaxID=254056 RepID=A0A177FKS6_9EURO|nr:hypothetical protein AYO21_01986 [Fonsecaea monophora]KAH0844692.1 hypothetical protein FOPE_09715 [Fonsecaea pedrosoi]OAG43759.1 hypothetical protein AYO21_01986 [Fonsecaea monophora]
MPSKVVLLSAIVACGSAALLSEQRSQPVDNGVKVILGVPESSSQIRSPLPMQNILAFPNLPAELRKRATNTDKGCFTVMGDTCEDPFGFFACAADANSGECILSARCTINFEDCLSEETSLQSRQDGGGSPFDPELNLRSSDETDSSVNAELVERGEIRSNAVDKNHLEAREDARISDEIQAAVPAEVKDAMLNDANAAESLANEFTSGSVPQWFAQLPASVTNYYATITPPPTMIAYALRDATIDPERQSVENWIASIQSYKELIASVSRAASSESDSARRLSKAASEKSKWASEERDGLLQTSAWEQSRLALSMSSHAAVESSYAASASRTVYDRKAEDGEGNGAYTGDARLALGSSIVGAVVCLGLAFGL